MANWSRRGYWRWWWNHRAGPEVKLFTVLAPVLAVAVLGFLLAGKLPTDVEAASRLETFTVERVVTVRSNGEARVITRPVSVVRRVTQPGSTGIETRVVLGTTTTPGGERVVTTFQSVIRTEPGEVETIVSTRGGVTRTNVVTNERVVTDRRTVTSEQVVTQVQERVVTDVRTQQVTVPVTTVRTVTEEVPVTQTVTQVVTETVTAPPEILPPTTVTVTCPPKGCG